MTTFEVIKQPIRAAKMNGEASTPSFGSYCHKMSGYTSLDEREGLFVGYGFERSCFPYRQQNMYSSELYDTEIETVILENEYLKATFYPTLGGKLASLIDKEKGRDLLFCNPVIRPRNLAIRNAWMSGGVEWNCGFFGHHVHTCDTLFTAKAELEDGTPVLRMYEYERIRRAVVQMDFFLPEGSRMLYARMRVTNTTPEVIPMYWWSNIAVREDPDGRVITMANSSYVADGGVSVVDIPYHNGNEVSYPTNIPTSIDYFYKIPDKARKFECYVGDDGYGFVQCSTSRLQGRKLFVWGQGAGGDRWQEYLSGDGDNGRYVELQAGLAHSQYESLPMPPAATWEWLEGYGAISGDAEKLHGEWKDAQTEALRALDSIITEDALDGLLDATYGMATSPADGIIMEGSGWGALEKLRRKTANEPDFTPHLDFGDVGAEQADWVALLKEETLPEHSPDADPVSFMYQPEWTAMLERAVTGPDRFNWYARYQLGAVYFAEGKIDEARVEMERSFELCPSSWAMNALGHIALEQSHPKEGAVLAIRAALMKPDDISMARDASAWATQLGMYDNASAYIDAMSETVLADDRVRLNVLFALIRMKKIDEAEKVLYADGGIEIADIREGENLITDLYLELEELKAKRDGRDFDRNTVVVPKKFDYRMGVARKEDAGTGRAKTAQERAKARG